MIAAVALAVVILALLVLHDRQVASWRSERAELLEAARIERARLLDRIQHPETRQVEPGPIVEHEQPRDAAEMAMVGQMVPEFVSVGTPED